MFRRVLQEEFKNSDPEFLESAWVPSQMMMVSGADAESKEMLSWSSDEEILNWMTFES